jgi:hypothetical protein
MGSQNSPTWLLWVRLSTFVTIQLLSPIILAIASSQAIESASISVVSADGALLAYSVIVPLFSLFYLIFYHILRTLSPDVHNTIANSTLLLFSILMIYGWLINTMIWTHCEIKDGAEIYKDGAEDKVCPLRTRRMSTFKVVFGWAVMAVFLTHTVVTAKEILNNNKAAQQADKAKLCDMSGEEALTP